MNGRILNGFAGTMIVVFLLTGCASSVAVAPVKAPEEGNDLLNSVVWIQSAAEADALRMAVFASAKQSLDAALEDHTWSAMDQSAGAAELPPALIVDVDETILDNSPSEARLIREGKTYTPETWREWVEERQATALPGSLEFIKYAESKGVTIFYVTNRSTEEEAATRDNLEKEGFPLDARWDVVLTKGEKGARSDKTSRRAIVASTHRVVLLFGDDLGDFTSREGTVAERRARVESNKSRWGKSWFVLPNPMYGSWDRVLPGSVSGMSSHDRKMESLDEKRP